MRHQGPWVHAFLGENCNPDDSDVSRVAVAEVCVGVGNAGELKCRHVIKAGPESINGEGFSGIDQVSAFGEGCRFSILDVEAIDTGDDLK